MKGKLGKWCSAANGTIAKASQYQTGVYVVRVVTLVERGQLPINIWMLAIGFFLIGLGLWFWVIFSLYRTQRIPQTIDG